MSDTHAYPRPQLVRTHWLSLNGDWQFAIDKEATWILPKQVVWNASITVPFSPETPASGVVDTGFYKACWYRREFESPVLTPGERLILHFGAVDHTATVWVNNQMAVRHEGGYTPFHVDITEFLLATGPQTIVVRAEDDPHDLAKPRGKQDWRLQPHGIWYPRTTGIWQTVWVERVSSTRIGQLWITPSTSRWEIGLEAGIEGEPREGMRLSVYMHSRGRVLADDTYSVSGVELHRRIPLPGEDDDRNDLLWTPCTPTLIEMELKLWDNDGELLDSIRSYTAIRSVEIDGDRFMLNGSVCQLRLVLDQGYWPESGLTPPSDDALRRDIELAKAMGFNGVRKHQKIEDPRFLYWADVLGLLVWEEMPSAYRFTKRAVERLTSEWLEVVRRDINHPSIVAWVPFNESWGVPDLADSPTQRHYLATLYHLTKTLDPSRLVIGNDGWESVATDIIGIHDYADNPDHLACRYGSVQALEALLEKERPGGRKLILDPHARACRALVLSEFGGIGFSEEQDGTWGYTRCETAEELCGRYSRLMETVRSLPLLTGFCYTQLTDTYQEVNGLLYPDRTPKFPIEDIACATAACARYYEHQEFVKWQQRDRSTPAVPILAEDEEYIPR